MSGEPYAYEIDAVDAIAALGSVNFFIMTIYPDLWREYGYGARFVDRVMYGATGLQMILPIGEKQYQWGLDPMVFDWLGGFTFIRNMLFLFFMTMEVLTNFSDTQFLDFAHVSWIQLFAIWFWVIVYFDDPMYTPASLLVGIIFYFAQYFTWLMSNISDEEDDY